MATAKPWNPMEEAYKNKNFNKYTQGPGADLDENLQPGAMASSGGGAGQRQPERFQICLKNVPSEMSEKAIFNLCANYAHPTFVKRSPKTPYVFVTFPTLSDMERALEGIRRDNPQGITADMSKQTAASINNPNSSNAGSDRKSDRDKHSDAGSSGPDMSKRTIKGPFTKPERKPLVERKPFVSEKDYENSNLKIVDPDREFLVERDMHDRDRNNPNKDNDNEQGGRKMYTGRAYYKDSKETSDNLKRLAINSKGNYNAEKDEFLKGSSQFEKIASEVQYCTLCRNLAEKVCQRCGDYYCSIECQRKDWGRHRLICFPMPELIAPVHVPHASCSASVHSEDLSSVPNLNNSFEANKKVNTPRQHNRGGENRQDYPSKTQQHGGDNRRGAYQQDDGPKNRYQNDQQDNRKNDWNQKNNDQFGNRRNDYNQKDKNHQDSRKNDWNEKNKDQPHDNRRNDYNQKDKSQQGNRGNDWSQKDRESNMGGGAKKDFGQRGDRDTNKGNTSLFENNKQASNNQQPQGEASSKPSSQPPIVMPRADYPPSGSIVAITAVIRPNKVYIRSMASEDNVEYVKTINFVNNQAKNAKPLLQIPKKGDFAITDFQGDGFYRALVLNPESEDKIMVAFVDFGNVDFKKLSELKVIPDELIPLKRQALNVVLKGVEDFEPTAEIQAYMDSFVDAVDKDLRLIYEKKGDKGPLEVELVEVASNENFNKSINELRQFKPATLTDEPVFTGDIKTKALPAGNDTALIVLDTSLIQMGTISCVLESDLGEIDKMTAIFADYAKDTKGPYTPRVQEICLVLYDDGCWYRAECIEVVGDQNPTVVFTDFGNVATVHIDKIRKYPRSLIVPCVTITCLLSGVPEEINQPLADRLKELIPANDKIIANKVEVIDEQTSLIYLNDVIKKLTDEKLI